MLFLEHRPIYCNVVTQNPGTSVWSAFNGNINTRIPLGTLTKISSLIKFSSLLNLDRVQNTQEEENTLNDL